MKFQILKIPTQPIVRFTSAALLVVTILIASGGSTLQAQTIASDAEARFAYVGTYTRGAPGGWSSAARDEAPVGVTVYSLGSGMGDLSLIQTVASDNPSWVTIHPSQNYLYVSNEIQDFDGEERGTIEAYSIDDTSGELTFINRVTTAGIPAQINPSHEGDYLAVAAYTGQTFELLPIDEDGSLGDAVSVAPQEGSGPHSRQTSSHPHSVVFDPSGAYLVTADLGTDSIKVFSFADGILEETSSTQMTPGSGPRHLAFHPDGEILYVITELTANVVALEFDASSGALGEQLQVISTVPANYPSHKSTAEIMVHPSGQFLYASNRKFEDHHLADSIVTYSIDDAGMLRLVGFTTHADIRTARTFNIDPTGTWLYVMGQKGDAIVQFHINPNTGALTPTGNLTHTKVPVSMAFKQ